MGPTLKGISAPRSKGRETKALLFSLAYEDTVRSCPAVSPGREASQNLTMLAGTLISDFHPPEVLENIFLLFKPPSQWYSVIAAQAETNIKKKNRVENTHFGTDVLSEKTGLCLISCLLLGGR